MMRPRGPVARRLKAARMAVKNPLIHGLSAWMVRRLDRRPRTLDDLDASPPRRILVIRTDRIGDLLCGTPLIAALHRRWPEAGMTLVGGRRNRSVMPLLPYLTRAPLEFARHPVRWIRLAGWLSRQGFDMAVNLRSEAFAGAWLAGLSGAPVRMVVNASRTAPAFNLVLGPDDEHQLRRFWKAAAQLGVEWPEVRPIIEVPAAAAEQAEAFVRGLGVPPSHPLIGVGIPNRSTARHRRKAWSHARLAELVRLLGDRGARVLLFGVGAERREAEAIAARVPAAALAPPLPLPVVAGIQRRLSVLVSSFTGTLHLADGVGTPTVSIGETGVAAVWHPLGANHRTVAAANPVEIPVEAVLEAIADLLDGRVMGLAQR